MFKTGWMLMKEVLATKILEQIAVSVSPALEKHYASEAGHTQIRGHIQLRTSNKFYW